jgi:hypothetical protein
MYVCIPSNADLNSGVISLEKCKQCEFQYITILLQMVEMGTTDRDSVVMDFFVMDSTSLATTYIHSCMR